MSANVWLTRICKFGTVALIVAVVLLLIAGPGHRFGVFAAGTAVLLSAAAGFIALLALLASLISLVLSTRPGAQQSFSRILLTTAIAGALTLQMFSWYSKAKSVPMIHDISTDTQNPPLFDAIIPLRADAANPHTYDGEDVAKLQLEAYPDIQTHRIDNHTVAQVISAAKDIATQLGWEVVATDQNKGTLEATDTTFWYGYKDDIVFRAVTTDSGVAVDMRSKSRVGRSDLGTNAKRIANFLAQLDTALAN